MDGRKPGLNSSIWLVWLALTAVVLSLDFSLSRVVGMDTDFWWHLAAGQRIFQVGLELRDPYSFTHPQQEWVRIDWLFQVASYVVYQAGGLTALLATRSLLVLLSGLLLAATLRRNRCSWGVCWCLVVLTAHVWGQAVALRPASVSMFFTALVVWVLEEARHGKPWMLWVLAPLITVWFNIHVAALAGCLIVGIYSTAHLIDCWLLKSVTLDRRWLMALPLCLLAVFVNPQTWRLAYLPIHFLLFKSPWNQVILEVQTPAWNWPGTMECRLLLVLAIVGSFIWLREGCCVGLVLTLAFGFLVVSTYRHQFQFCGILSCMAGPALQKLSRPVRWPLVLVSLLLATRALLLLTHQKLPLAGLVRRETFAEEVALLTTQGPQGLRLFTDMNSAGYYVWRTQGRQKVFIDARGEQVYVKPHFVESYFEILWGGPYALQLLDHYQVEAVANNRLTSANSKLFTELLPKSPLWVRLYADNTGEFYCRKELRGCWTSVPPPPAYLEAYNQALRFQAGGNWDRALDAFQQSLLAYPQFASAYQGMARVWLSQPYPNTQNARRSLARAELLNPDSPGLESDWTASGRPWPAWMRWYFLPFWAI